MSLRLKGFLILAAILVLSIWGAQSFKKPPEIALIIGEPWQDMQQRSSAEIGSPKSKGPWFTGPKQDSRLRLADAEYEFVTPIARFFTVTYEEDGTVWGVRMSPQVETLSLEDALKVIFDLQRQWLDNGWAVNFPEEFSMFVDTPAWRELVKERGSATSFWVAGKKYHIMLIIHQFNYDVPPGEERYLITLQLTKYREDLHGEQSDGMVPAYPPGASDRPGL